MVATKEMTSKLPKGSVDYDPVVDVLRLVLAYNSDNECETVGNGIEIDYDTKQNTAIGATIIGYKKNNWDRNVGALSKIIASYVDFDEQELSEAIIMVAGGHID